MRSGSASDCGKPLTAEFHGAWRDSLSPLSLGHLGREAYRCAKCDFDASSQENSSGYGL